MYGVGEKAMSTETEAIWTEFKQTLLLLLFVCLCVTFFSFFLSFFLSFFKDKYPMIIIKMMIW